MNKFLSSIFLIIIFSSCSYLVKSIKDKPINLKNNKPQICHLKKQHLFIGGNSQIIKAFDDIEQFNLSREEIIYAWALANSKLMPDLINPKSFGGVFLIERNQTEIKFHSFNNLFNKINKSKISNLLNQIVPKKLKTGGYLSRRLRQFKSQFPDKDLPKKYLVAKQVVSESELINRGPYTNLNIFNHHNVLPEKFKSSNEMFQCLGFGKEGEVNETAILAIVHNDWHAIMTFSGKLTSNFLEPEFSKPTLSLCQATSPSYQNTYISYTDLHHESLMNNLTQLGIYNISNIEDLIYYINYPRFILYNEAKYIHLESLRADETLESYLNTLNIPIYHKNNIGEIHSIYHFQQNKQAGFLIDSREPVQLKCF